MSDQQLIEDHIEYHERIRDYAQSTLKAHRRILEQWLSFVDYRRSSILKASGKHIIEFIAWRQSQQVENSTVLAELCIIRVFYTFLSEHKRHHNMPIVAIPSLICETTDEQKYLTVDECMTFLNGFDTSTADGLRNHTIFALLWSTGIRTAELTNLKWKDFDLENESFRVRKGKGRKERQLFLNDRLLNDMETYHNTVSNRANDCVFPAMSSNSINEQGEKLIPLSASRLQQITREHAVAVGLDKKVSPKTFRHTFATHMFEVGIPMEDLKEMMGHSNETETTVYVHVTMDAIRNQIRFASENKLRK